MLKTVYAFATIPTEMSCPHFPRTEPALRTIPWPQPVETVAQCWVVETIAVVAVPWAAIVPNLQDLSPDEQAHAARLRHQPTQQTFLAARTLLRQWLSQVTGRPASHLTLGTGPHGKPFLVEDPDLQFNLSHGGDWLMIALADRHAVGIDLEPIQPRRQLPRLCRRYLSAGEASSVLSLPSDQAQLQFLRHWTCKEAYVKGLGVGLTRPLATVDLTLHPGPQPHDPRLVALAQGLEPGWRIYQWQPIPGYAAALALKSEIEASKPD